MNENNENQIVTTDGKPTDLIAPNDNSMLAFVNPVDMPNLENAEVGMSIEQKYYEFSEKGQKVRAIYNGLKHIITKKGEDERQTIPAIVFQNKDGVFLNAGASLVEQLSNIPPGTPIEITYLGKEKTNSGFNVNKFDVRLLNVKVPFRTVQVKKDVEAPKSSRQKDEITAYWEAIKARGLTQQDGLDHLAYYRQDFVKALDALVAQEGGPF